MAPPIPQWGAERIVKLLQEGMTPWRVADRFSISESVVKIIWRHFLDTGDYRSLKQGQGKCDDPRWVYAGPRAAGNIRALEYAHASGSSEDLLREVWHRHLSQGVCEPAFSTMTEASLQRLDLTTKRLTRVACERDEARCALWIERMRQYDADDLVLIDETCAQHS